MYQYPAMTPCVCNEQILKQSLYGCKSRSTAVLSATEKSVYIAY